MKLKQALAGTVPEESLRLLSNHFDVIGNVAVLSLPSALEPYKKTVAAAIMAGRRNIYTVLNKVTMVTGDARTARYEVLSGGTTVTLHTEFGFRYRLDVTKAFFSTALAYERMRVTDQVEPGERVLVPFCGIGPFAIPAAARGAPVTGIEKNADAFFWLNENVALNHVRNLFTAIRGDAFDTSPIAGSTFDRIIIPTPYGMDAILPVLSRFLAPGGMIHFYTFRNRRQVPGILAAFAENGFSVTYYRSCGNVAPGISRWVFDIETRTG
ncbi:MAG TPA: RsmD family RNA methyltransferase [Methanoregula sp.]|nr:RsmD family RNA methyltransferase [Methanoregula sp.]